MKVASKNAIVDDALRYLDRGIGVIPVNGKIAALAWDEFKTSRMSILDAKREFSQKGVSGVAVVSGAVSGGLAIRDFDTQESFERWQECVGANRKHFPTVKSPNGHHVWCRVDEQFAFTRIFDDGEYRGSKCYTLAPSSSGADGGVYEWEIRLRSELPEVTDPYLVGMLPTQQPIGQPSNPMACVPKGIERMHVSQQRDEVEKAIFATLPTGPGQRNRKLFELVRELRRFLPKETSDGDLYAIVDAWFQRALPVIRSKDFEESWFDFRHAWQKCKYAAGAGQLNLLVQLADESPIPAIANRYDGDDALQALVRLCMTIQDHRPDGVFFLSVRKVQDVFKVSRMQAWRMLHTLLLDGVLEQVSPGRLRGRQAASYRMKG